MSTLQAVELGVLGPLQVRRDGAPVIIPGAKPRAILTMLGLHSGSVVSAETLIELLWGDDPPRTAAKALQTHISSLRRTLGDGFVLTEGTGWTLAESEVDASRYKSAARLGRDAAAAGDTSQAVSRFEEALALWRGIPELPDGRRGTSEKTRWVEGHAALVEDRADALLVTGRAAEIIGELEAAVAEAPLRERRWGQLMLALYRAGRQGDALGAYQRARALLADELGVDPGPDLRRLEAAIVGQDAALEIPAAQDLPSVTRTVTFLLTDIEGSTAAWEADADAMAVALARHDELVEQVVTSRGGRLIKTRGEGDATFSVFERASAAAAAAIELQDAIFHEPWGLQDPMRIRVALHTGEVELRDGDYFGRAVNRAARLRSLAVGGQILCSGAIAELVVDSLPDDVVLADLGMRQLRNLARPEHVFELRLETAAPPQKPNDAPIERPGLPAVLTGPGPFVGRGRELEGLVSAWQTALAGGTHAVLIAGEPGVGKTRLAGEWSQQAYQLEAIVLYGRCDEDLGAPYQPFAEALRSLMPCLGTSRLRGMRGVEALLTLVPGLTEVLPDLAAPTRADPETERYALFDAVVALLELASADAPVVLILDDLHWAAKPTLLLLRHLLRFGDRARVQIVGTYRSTDLDRSHPLAAMLADLHRGAGSGTANRLALSGLDEADVTAYVTEAGYNDEELARALASVTGGNPFFLIEALRHVDETGGVWDPTTLPQGVRETVSRRLSRLPAETNTALAAAAVVGSRFALDLVEKVVEQDLVDAFDEACKAGIVIEEPGGRYRFNHAIVRQSLLAELPSVRRQRLHQRIATTLEAQPGADDELLAELAHHYFECAWAGNAAKAVEYCRRAADQAVARLGYEAAADLYGQALHALEEIDDELPDRDEQAGELLVARCEALLAAGDVTLAAGAVSQLQRATVDSARLAAWATCFDGELSMLIHPERLDEVEAALGLAAQKLAEIDDAAGEAKAHTVRAACLARLGRIGDGEIALDDALTAARRARDHRRVNAVLAGAPLAALWGPNPVPRAGGRCLDVVRLLRITTDSPAVEATSTRCQAVLEAFRGRGAAARRMIDSARRTVTELGLRHALLEVEQFAGIVELIVDDPTAAEPHFRQAYNGFRRMGLDADTAETAALLGRTCLALDRDTEADELCLESERLAGNALKASIAWRTLRARLLSRGHEHGEARRTAEAAVALAERTDALVDHGDSCLTLATVLGAAGDAAGAHTAAERAVDLYERKGAAALAEKARLILGDSGRPSAPAPPEAPPLVELDNACIRSGKRLAAAINREAWDEFEQLYAPEVFSESHRKVIGFTHAAGAIVPPENWAHEIRRVLGASGVRLTAHDIAVRGERLALARLVVGTSDTSPGAPRDEFLQIYGIDEEGRISLQIFFDLEDMDAAVAELESAHARFEAEQPKARRLENRASRVYEHFLSSFAARDWDVLSEILAADLYGDDRRPVLGVGIQHGRDAMISQFRTAPDLGVTQTASDTIAARGDRLILARTRFSRVDEKPEAFRVDLLLIVEINADERISAIVAFDVDEFDAAIAELDARYLAGEAAAHAHVLQPVMDTVEELNRHKPGTMLGRLAFADHRRVPFGSAENYGRAIEELWTLVPDAHYWTKAVHALDAHGLVSTLVIEGTDAHGNELQWGRTFLFLSDGPRVEVYEEDGVDAALARFEELRPHARRLENAASQATERHSAHFAARDWDALAKVLADDILVDDRRRVVNAGVKRGRDAEIANLRAVADVGITYTAFVVIAARGERLILTRASVGGSAEFSTDALSVLEINSHNQIAAIVIFELDDFDDAITELDARYLAGEAEAHAHTWSVVTGTFASVSRQELPALTPDCATIDHRRVTAFAPGEMTAYIRAGWEIDQTIRTYAEVVHRLSDLGAVCTYAAHGVSREGFDGDWRGVNLATVDGDMVNRSELFDETDVDAALARFDQLRRPAPRLENAASQVSERYMAHFAARDWDELAKVLADDICVDDRRRVVNAGIKHGRDAEIANLRAAADVGITYFASVVIAARGQRLILARVSGGEGGGSGEFLNEVLGVIEINSDDLISTIVLFELDDFDAAVAELDARYIAGEAAAHANTWSVIARANNGFNRGEIPATTQDWVNIDLRRVIAFAPGDMTPYIRATWDVALDIKIHIEAVHRLSNLGAVFTHVGTGISRVGSEAEWREITLVTLEGDLINRCELFDEADLHTALAKFDQLSRRAPRLENVASRVYEHFLASFAARDWAAVAQLLADDISTDDRRRVVNSGTQDGREANIASMRALADLGVMNMTSEVIATRGNFLVLCRIGSAAFQTEVLNIVEIDAEDLIVAVVGLDLDDFDAAIAELDARYIAGEAGAHARTWSVIAGSYATMNRHEDPPKTLEFVGIDHRRGTAFAPGEHAAYVRAAWDQIPDLSYRVEAVHRLTDLGVVVTHTKRGTSQEGFEAEWREINLLTVEGDLFNRSEVFDEEDLDAAIARFEELHPPTPRLENSATRAWERLFSYIAAGDWDAWAQTTAENVSLDDRRRVVNAGIRHGRDANIKDTQATLDVGFAMTTLGALATRGERLALIRVRVSGRDPAAIQNDALNIVEIDAGDRIVAGVVFDLDDFDAAFAELDARYIAGEAAAHAGTWSVIAGVFVAHNQREIAAVTTDAVSLDHRRGAAFAPGEGFEYIRAGWDLDQSLNIYIEAAHRVNDLGAVFTWAGHGTSHEGFEAEWRGVTLMTVDGEMVSRMEVFDEGDLDAALAKFDQLSRPTPRLENAASQAMERFQACFAARDWDAMAEMMAEDVLDDDRRRVVRAGVRRGRDAEITNMQAIADIGAEKLSPTVIATRGERLVLLREHVGNDELPEAFQFSDVLQVAEIGADERFAAVVTFDLDNFDDAITELDARYIAGEAAPYRDAWSVIAAGYAALNRYEVPPSAPDYVNIDHRLQATFEAADLGENLGAAWDLTPELKGYIEVVHRLSGLGAVVTHAAHGTTQDGLDAEWRGIHFLTLEGGMVNRCEIFSEADLDAALAKFNQLNVPALRLKNAVAERLSAHILARDWDALAHDFADAYCLDDRRRVVNAGVMHGRDAGVETTRVASELGMLTNTTSTIIASRGERLTLERFHASGADHESIQNEALNIVEIDADERIAAVVMFDVDDIDAALAELDARYLADEAGPHAHTWSVIARIYAGFNRREPPATTPDSVFTDHRPLQNLGTVDLVAAIRSMWDVASELNVCIEAVHRLSELGAVVTQTLKGTSQQGLDAEWRTIEIFMVEGDLLSRCEAFDEKDLDAALARFEELHPPTPQLENAASQVYNRVNACFASRNWAAMAEVLAQNMVDHDRRRAVNAGIRRGRDVEIGNSKAVAELGGEKITSIVIATRGAALALCHTCIFLRDHQLGESRIEFLSVIEIDAEERLAVHVAFDFENIDAAVAELDARYLVGEAAAHAQTWSVIMRAYAALNRRELPATTQDWATIDHRRGTSFASGEMPALLDAVWNLTTDLRHSIEAVHRLNDVGAVVTNTSHETSQEGFDAEWRVITVATVEGDLLNRCEVFDEADLDAALARFDELSQSAPRLENAVSKVCERFQVLFAARDWDAMADMLAENFLTDDRRRLVNAGIRHGRDAEIENYRAAADIGIIDITLDVIATRGERLVLGRVRGSQRDQLPGNFGIEVLGIVEIDVDDRIVAAVSFDLDEIDAAFEELDARYLAGEAAAHAPTWSVIAGINAAFNRRELPEADWVTIDHRPLPIIEAYSQAALRVWDVTPDFVIHSEAVHRLSGFGAVATYQANGASPEGFDGEWRMILLLTVQGDRIDRCEVFDESDLASALARFDELRRQPLLENAAGRIVQRYLAHFAARDWAAFAELLADDIVADDRRRVVNAGIRRGRDVHIADNRVIVEVSAPTVSSSIIATRGERLALANVRIFNRGMSGEVGAEVLGIAEIDADERIVAIVTFDPDDIDAAFEELDARYLTGEAAAHSHTWSVVTQTYAAFNRHEILPTTPDWINVDHRRLARVSIQPNDMTTYLGTIWDLTPDLTIYAEAVHRLSERGAVVTHGAHGRSPQGFEAEWRMVEVLMVDSELISRCELFDEADLDAAVARFDELHPQPSRLENAASRLHERFLEYYAARDSQAMAEMLADNYCSDDRRRVVGSGVRHGRDAHIADMRARAELWNTNLESTVIAIRGERLALMRIGLSDRDEEPEAFSTEVLAIGEIDADERIVASVTFDLDEIDAAFAELDARYLVGEASVYAQTWSAVAGVFAAFNRRELPASDYVAIDYRRATLFTSSELAASNIHALWDLISDISIHIEAAHRLSGGGAVVTVTARGTSPDGFDAEWRMIQLVILEGDRLNRCELFDEADLDAALARFDELRPQPLLENAAGRILERYFACFSARDWAAMTELLVDDIVVDDRRRVVNAGIRRGRDVYIADNQAAVEVGADTISSSVIATRGKRLALARVRSINRGMSGEVGAEMLGLAEIDADERIVAGVIFDLEDVDAAFEELDARYLAGDASDYAHTWSAIARTTAAFNRHELPAADWVIIDHRPLAPIDASDLPAAIRAIWDLTPDLSTRIEAVHRLSSFGAVVTNTACGTSSEGFAAEWRVVDLVTVEGDRISRDEFFDEADIDTALARFDELDRRRPSFGNAATRIWARAADAFNRRDVDSFFALMTADGRFEDRRKGLRAVHKGAARRKAVRAVFEEAPASWRMHPEPIATRGSRLELTRECYRDTDEADRPIAVQLVHVMELGDDDLMRDIVSFDPDDLDDAFAELTARWIASGEVAYPELIEAVDRIHATINRHDWDAVATYFDGAEYVNHRQLGHAVNGTIADWLSSLQTTGSLVPNFWVELAEILARSAIGIVGRMVLKGTSTDGAAIEIAFVVLILLHGERVTRLEAFEEDQRDVALARLQEFNRPV